ncbi:hypothetical protein [Abyssalbus ytuae]|uniref:Uncharacterized protein n=1 Tax=Abyssalbus ytuae TaxID=2926907 RepID=A0A9E6ZUB9_9FLAO|nr:hypothetical protein [Abyssalbus ytuae]UOB19068.1 hypothetical protein MQE35_07160 [Abyssalbus ytuae]
MDKARVAIYRPSKRILFEYSEQIFRLFKGDENINEQLLPTCLNVRDKYALNFIYLN